MTNKPETAAGASQSNKQWPDIFPLPKLEENAYCNAMLPTIGMMVTFQTSYVKPSHAW